MSRRDNVFRLFEDRYDFVKDKIENGIEQNRKGYAFIEIKDGNGKPVDAKIEVKQKSHEFKFGANLFMLDQMETEEKNQAYKENFANLFNMATLPFYWKDLEPEKDKPRYSKGSPNIYRRPAPDLCVEFCRKHGIEPREHGLAYDTWFPEWLKGADEKTFKLEYERRCREISERYADSIPTIEVTNEQQWALKSFDFCYDLEYVADCFKIAEKYFPHNTLSINEYQGIFDSYTIRDLYCRTIENALLKGARIDLIGTQFHMFFSREQEQGAVKKRYDPKHVYDVLDTLAKFGKPLEITEVTIPAYSWEAEDEEIQADIIEKMYSLWFSHPSVKHIIYWNLVDGYAAFAPRGDMTSGENYYHGGLMRFDMTKKPAYQRLYELINNVWHTEEKITAKGGKASFKGFFGNYELTIKCGNKIVKRDIFLGKDRINCFHITLDKDTVARFDSNT